MPVAPLRPEYGPSLPGLLRPRWERLSPPARRALTAMGACLAVVVLAGAILYPRGGGYSRGGTYAFDIGYGRALHRVPAGPGYFLRVEQGGPGHLVQSLAVGPLDLGPYQGDPDGQLPLYAADYLRRRASELGHFLLLGEGKTRVNGTPGYTVLYRGRLDGQEVTGRDDLIVQPVWGRRHGVIVQIVVTARAHIGGATLIGTNGSTGDALQTLNVDA